MSEGFDGSDWYRQAWQLIREAALDISDEFEDNIASGFNALSRVRSFDCEGNWVLYVETALPALAKSMWLLLVPSIDEILEEYLNPKSGRGGSRRGRRRRRRWGRNSAGFRRLFWRGGIPDMDEAIARRIPGGRAIRGRRVGPGEWLFWTGVQAADRVAWYWLLTEAFDTFATVWQDEIKESGQCKTSGPARLGFSAYDPDSNIGGPCWFSVEDENKIVEQNAVIGTSGNIQATSGRVLSGWCVCTFEIRKAQPPGDFAGSMLYTLTADATDNEGTRFTIARSTGTLHVDGGGLDKVKITVEADFAFLTAIQFNFSRQLIEGSVGTSEAQFGYAANVRLTATSFIDFPEEPEP